jgi:hypothetical protein
VIGRGTLGIAAALVLGWSLGAVMTHPLPANAHAPSFVAPAPFTGPNAARRHADPAKRHHRARGR